MTFKIVASLLVALFLASPRALTVLAEDYEYDDDVSIPVECEEKFATYFECASTAGCPGSRRLEESDTCEEFAEGTCGLYFECPACVEAIYEVSECIVSNNEEYGEYDGDCVIPRSIEVCGEAPEPDDDGFFDDDFFVGECQEKVEAYFDCFLTECFEFRRLEEYDNCELLKEETCTSYLECPTCAEGLYGLSKCIYSENEEFEEYYGDCVIPSTIEDCEEVPEAKPKPKSGKSGKGSKSGKSGKSSKSGKSGKSGKLR